MSHLPEYQAGKPTRVTVAAPGSSRWADLGRLGPVTVLTCSWTGAGACDRMTAVLLTPAAFRARLLSPGWRVRVIRGRRVIWTGKAGEPVPAADGWALSAAGTGAVR